jgi:hypothetical protein
MDKKCMEIVSQTGQRTNDARTIQGVKTTVGVDTGDIEKSSLSSMKNMAQWTPIYKEVIGRSDEDQTKLRDLDLE